jgi:two-component system response regulator RegX3
MEKRMTAKDKSTVLVVDDEEDLRDAISFDLQRKGFNVLTAASGNEAFEMIKQHKIDVVFFYRW